MVGWMCCKGEAKTGQGKASQGSTVRTLNAGRNAVEFCQTRIGLCARLFSHPKMHVQANPSIASLCAKRKGASPPRQNARQSTANPFRKHP